MIILSKGSIPVVIAFSFMILLNAVGGSNIYGQIVGNTTQTNQTSISNQTGNITQAKQQSEKMQAKNLTAMSDKLLNFTNSAIIALDHKDTKTLKHDLAQLQSTLINASGKQVVIIPSDAVPSE